MSPTLQCIWLCLTTGWNIRKARKLVEQTIRWERDKYIALFLFGGYEEREARHRKWRHDLRRAVELHESMLADLTKLSRVAAWFVDLMGAAP